jgi:hypothetical protein
VHAHHNQLDYETLDMATIPSVEKAQVLMNVPDTGTFHMPKCTLNQIAQKASPTVDGLCKLLCVPATQVASSTQSFANTRTNRVH